MQNKNDKHLLLIEHIVLYVIIGALFLISKTAYPFLLLLGPTTINSVLQKKDDK